MGSRALRDPNSLFAVGGGYLVIPDRKNENGSTFSALMEFCGSEKRLSNAMRGSGLQASYDITV